jgi:PAS domain S-box-containing protein
MIWRYFQGTRKVVLVRAFTLIAMVALIDWRVDLNLSFGFLYLVPMLLAGSVLSWWQIVIAALVCTVFSDIFDPFPFLFPGSLPQDILVFSALTGAGLFAHQLTTNRRRESENLRRIEAEIAARREAEEQLEFLIESSPAAILTMSAEGEILLANAAAHHLFGVDAGALPGTQIARYIPALGHVPSARDAAHQFRTEMQCRGHRENGDVFLANVFFSTYQTGNGPRLAALIADASEELRDREESSLQQLLAGSRILAAAVSHEVRNACGAISIVYENLARSGISQSKDFEALGSLVQTLNRIASVDLRESTSTLDVGGVDLREVLGDLRIVLEPQCQESGIAVTWEIPASVPRVWADRHSLMQVLLNLIKNSQRALEHAANKRMNISVSVAAGSVHVRVFDSGPGIASTENLFQPFQTGAASMGLGLFLSRAFMRFFGGELRHEPTANGCCFVIELSIAASASTNFRRVGEHVTNPIVAAG